MITVAPEGLTAAGAGLSGLPGPGSAPACEPPAGDPVSAGVAAVFNSHANAVGALLAHAAVQRAAGGASVSGSAQTLRMADGANGAAIAGGNPPALGAAIPAAVAAIPPPVLAGVPALPAPAPLAGEQLAALVHSGPGPGSLRAMAQALRGTAQRVGALADDTRRYGAVVDQSWADGRQRAGANVSDHADWLAAMEAHVSSLADGAEEAADHADSLIAATPRPEEFADLRRRLRQAVADFNASRGLNAAPVMAVLSELSRKQGAAVCHHHR